MSSSLPSARGATVRRARSATRLMRTFFRSRLMSVAGLWSRPVRLSRLTRPGVLERLGNRLQRYRMRAAERNSVTTGEYWEQRARLLGQRAVLNASHSESEMRDVTAR